MTHNELRAGFERTYAEYHPRRALRVHFHGHSVHLPNHFQHLPHAHQIATLRMIYAQLHGMNVHNAGLVGR